MFNIIFRIRNAFFRISYKYILKPFFFMLDPELVHDQMIVVGRILGTNPVTRLLTRFCFSSPKDVSIGQNILGIKFENPIGLAGGFDKNAELTNIIPEVDFGFMEVGSITGNSCLGNVRPRLWRLKKSKGLIVWYGLKNIGVNEILRKLSFKKFRIPLGTNIAMTNCQANQDLEKAIQDYAKSFELLNTLGDYMTVNVSCPNAIGGQPFNESSALDRLFNRLDQIETKKPIFIKISPDTSRVELDKILDVVAKHRINGFIIGNLTKNRNNPKIVDKMPTEKGGISGKPVEDLANDLISYVYKKVGEKYVIVGCGGVFNAEDAYKKIRLGASLVQMITGMIFGGPQTISEINMGLTKLLKRDGFKNISEVVGIDVSA